MTASDPTPRRGARRSPGMSDVARRAGVSLGTVSNALNRPEIVTETTLQRIREAIDELGFVRNRAAATLAAGGADVVGLVLVSIDNSLFVDIARGAEEQLQAAGTSLLLANADVDLDKQSRYLSWFDETQVAGLLLAPLDAPLDAARRVTRRGRPLVLVNYADEEFCGVLVDEERGGHRAATHLLELGRRRLGFVGGPLRLQAVAERLRGARRAVAEHGDGATIVHLPTRGVTGREGRRVVDEALAVPRAERLDALLCASDALATSCIQALLDVHHVAVPDDIAVTGYDDNHFATDGRVPVTTMRQPGFEMGRAAARMLLEELAGQEGHEHRTMIVEPVLVPRQSTLGASGDRP